MILIRMRLASRESGFPGFVGRRAHCYHGYVKRLNLFSVGATVALAAVVSFAICAGGFAPANLPPVPTTVSSITPAELRMHLQFLASDELGGRYTLSPSFAIAARYLAAHLEAYGFRRAGDHGRFLHTLYLVSPK